jgi:hypothetical protein
MPYDRTPPTSFPMDLADGLVGADSPLEVEPVAGEPVDPSLAENAWANNPYVVRQKLRRLAKAAGVSLSEAQQMLSDSGAAVHGEKDARGQFTATERASQFAPLIDAAANARDAAETERMNRWKSQMMLASSNSRANMSNAFDMLSDEQKQRVIEARLTGGRSYSQNDPRLAIAQMEAESRRSEGEAARKSAAEIQAAAREEARLEREAVRAADQEKWATERQSRKLEFEERMEQARQQFEATNQKFQSERTAADASLKAQLAQTQAMLERGRGDNKASVEAARLAAEAAGAPATIALANMKREDDRRKDNMRTTFATTNPGAYHAAVGLQTPEAEEYLKNAAADADNFQWLPGGGFGSREAGSMNAALLALARQAEMAGVQSRLSDRAYREELIRRYGYASGWSGGRGGWFGDFWQPIPNDPPLSPQ